MLYAVSQKSIENPFFLGIHSNVAKIKKLIEQGIIVDD